MTHAAARWSVTSAFAGLCVLVGCVGASDPAGRALDARFVAADVVRIRTLAPDFLARADGAAADARGATSAAARADHQARALLLMDAAQAEADRIELDRKRATLEAQALAAERAAAQADERRVAIEDELRLLAAAQVAEQEATRAFAQAELAEEHTLANKAQRAEARNAASVFLVRRARATLAAAEAMGASAVAREQARQAIAVAVATPSDKVGETAGLLAAQRALALSQRALGNARAAAPAPSPQAAQDLLARAAELGFAASRIARGVVIGLPSVFAPGRAELSKVTERKLGPLRDLLAAFPHGPILIEAHAHAGSLVQTARLARARSERVSAFLSRTLAAERIVGAPEDASSTADDGVDLVLAAYGDEP